jgi:hypothetical protein
VNCKPSHTLLCQFDQYFGWVPRGLHYPLLTVAVAMMSFQGIANLHHQRSIHAEFSNAPLEEFVQWINSSTDIGIAASESSESRIKSCRSVT